MVRKKSAMAACSFYIFYMTSFIFQSTNPLAFVLRSYENKLKLPKTVHLSLTEKDIKDREIFIIGDVHGCLEELEELLQKATHEFKNKSILPIFVGDLANKGPHNAATIKKIRKMDVYAVRGNHEEKVLEQIMNLREDPNYDLPKRYKWVKNLDREDVNYLMELPYTLNIPSKMAIIVHAGLVPGIQLQKQNLTNVVTTRNLYKEKERLMTSESTTKGVPWASLWQGPEHVYFGHDAKRKLQLYQYATGLDTGCLYGSYLTGIFINSNKFLQVKAKKMYV